MHEVLVHCVKTARNNDQFLFDVSVRRTMLRTVREDVLEMEMSDREPAYVALFETRRKYVFIAFTYL